MAGTFFFANFAGMMNDATAAVPSRWDERTRRLLGDDAADALSRARVLVVGVGGVGGYAVEMLVRSGVGHVTAVDADAVDVTNLNRQIIATRDTVGVSKTAVMAQRARSINPEVDFVTLQTSVTPDNAAERLPPGYDYVLDCIDTVAPKVALLADCLANRVRVISSMGAGGRTDPSQVVYCDLWETRDDGLARAVRQRLKRMGLRRRLPVVASTERPHTASLIEVDTAYKRTSYGTVAPLPATFGIFMAAKVTNDLAAEARRGDSNKDDCGRTA